MSEHLRKAEELCRYLAKDADEVRRLTEEDGLPFVNLPGPTRPTVRFRLADVFEWLKKYDKAGRMQYADFLREFDSAQKKKKEVAG